MERPHERLEVWKKGIGLVTAIYSSTRDFPDSEKFGVISQLRSAAVSVPTNVAEGAVRHTNREFTQLLYISSGSPNETDTLLIICRKLKYLSGQTYSTLQRRTGKVSAMLRTHQKVEEPN